MCRQSVYLGILQQRMYMLQPSNVVVPTSCGRWLGMHMPCTQPLLPSADPAPKS